MSSPEHETGTGYRGDGGNGSAKAREFRHEHEEAYRRAEDRRAEELHGAKAHARGGYQRSDDKIFPLIRRVANEVTTLFSKELALLKVEMTSAVRDTRTGIGAMATGGAVLYAGLLMLLLSAVLGLATVMDAWLAALIVGVVVLIIGAIMLSAGKKKLEPEAFKPEHTTASMKKDRDMIKRNIHESHNR